MGIREKLNNKVREFGNNRTKRIKEISGKGLGDLLTTDINFRKAGATAGALVPLAFLYKFGSYIGVDGSNTIAKMIIAPILYGSTFPISIPTSVVLGVLGYDAGKKIDRLIGDKSLRIDEQDYEIRTQVKEA